MAVIINTDLYTTLSSLLYKSAISGNLRKRKKVKCVRAFVSLVSAEATFGRTVYADMEANGPCSLRMDGHSRDHLLCELFCLWGADACCRPAADADADRAVRRRPDESQ